SFDLTFAGGNSRPHVPDQLALTVKSTNAEVGAYTLTIQGSGPNGTPVHRRAIPLFVKPGRHSLATRVMSRWNLVSLPMTASDRSPKGVFPSSSSVAFGYDGTSYVVQDSFEYGKSYWLRFPDSGAVTIYGIPRDNDTIDVAEGWNMIGSISLPIDVGTIGSIPGGIVTSRFFGYEGRYSIADSIQPGKGYWVKTNQSGKFILSSSGAIASSSRIRLSPTMELPPAPPNSDAANRETRRPHRFTLEQNYPNPFNPRTSISYSIPRQSHVKLQVYNFLGELMEILVNEEKQPGTYSASWDASNRPSGLYFYRMAAGEFVQIRKAVLLK
ncbi:MAG TPA: T9SS type A sorting domain-containing protein, partial [Bacteroidota bacterium]|nr:T9SS type A sorting domain-containing protein [Bacteroidota bacterium]